MIVNDKAKGKKKFVKFFLIAFLSLILLSFIAFRVIVSSAFITGVILPVVSNSIDLRIDAEEVNLSIFKAHLTATKLVVGSGKTALVKAEKLDGYFSFLDLLKGRMVFHDVLLNKAIITIAKDSNGRWTYESPVDNIPAKSSTLPVKQAESGRPEKVFLDLKNIQIRNSTFILSESKGKSPAHMEFKDLNINLSELKNNEPGTLTLKSRVAIKNNSGITVEQGDWNLSLTATFDDYMHPYKLKLASKLDKLDGVINGVKINDSNFNFRCGSTWR